MSEVVSSNLNNDFSIERTPIEECPVCFRGVENDVFCCNKHIICAECYLKIKYHSHQRGEIAKCPQCRVEMSKQFEYRF